MQRAPATTDDTNEEARRRAARMSAGLASGGTILTGAKGLNQTAAASTGKTLLGA